MYITSIKQQFYRKRWKGKTMKPKKEDRRIIKTRNSIKKAFIEILEQTQSKDPSVQDITKYANINRSTFYAHYTDVFALRQEFEDELIEEIKSIFENTSEEKISKHNIENFWVYRFFNFMKENQQLCNILFTKNGNSQFTIKLTQALHQVINQNIHKNNAKTMPPIGDEYFSTFLAYGLVGIMRKWVQDEEKYSTEEIVQLCMSLTQPNIQ